MTSVQQVNYHAKLDRYIFANWAWVSYDGYARPGTWRGVESYVFVLTVKDTKKRYATLRKCVSVRARVCFSREYNTKGTWRACVRACCTVSAAVVLWRTATAKSHWTSAADTKLAAAAACTS